MQDQPRHALVKATAVRSARADLKRRITSGVVRVQDVICNPPPEAETPTLLEMLPAVRYVAEGKVRHVCRKACVEPLTRLGDLSERQQGALLEAMQEFPAFRGRA